MVLLILAFVTIEEANIAEWGNQEFLDKLESDFGIIEPSKRKVLFWKCSTLPNIRPLRKHCMKNV